MSEPPPEISRPAFVAAYGSSLNTLERFSMKPLLIAFLLCMVTSATSAMSAQLRIETKEVVYRGGLIRFSVPKHWIQKYEPDGGGIFYDDKPNAGTLRLSVITTKAPRKIDNKSTRAALESFPDVKPADIKDLRNGNAVTTIVERATEAGTPITLYWWYVANAVPPQHVRIAAFSYTVATANERAPQTRAELKFLDEAIQNVRFHPKLGE